MGINNVPVNKRIHMTTKQLTSIEIISVLHHKLDTSAWIKDMFFESHPELWDKYKEVYHTLDDVLTLVYNQMTTKQLRHLDAVCQHGEMRVGLKPPIHVDEFSLLPTDSVCGLLNVALSETCALCMGDKKDMISCKTRKFLKDIFQPSGDKTSGCEYKDITNNGDYGSYFKVRV